MLSRQTTWVGRVARIAGIRCAAHRQYWLTSADLLHAPMPAAVEVQADRDSKLVNKIRRGYRLLEKRRRDC
jgi:hypothetical protein